jgi:hypothetical protein
MAGAGYKDFTVGQILTSNEIDTYLMQQSTMVFATTTARDAAITAPSDGMMCYVNSGDANEGLYSYNGSAWRKGAGWNSAWGYLTTLSGSAIGTVLRSGSAATSVDLVSSTYTHINNRRVRITAQGNLAWTTSVNSAWRLQQGSTTYAYVDMGANDTFQGANLVGVSTTDGTAQTYKFSALFGASNSGVTLSAIVPSVVLEDMGPSGAPA